MTLSRRGFVQFEHRERLLKLFTALQIYDDGKYNLKKLRIMFAIPVDDGNSILATMVRFPKALRWVIRGMRQKTTLKTLMGISLTSATAIVPTLNPRTSIPPYPRSTMVYLAGPQK